MFKARIVVVEDELLVARDIRRTLTRLGYVVAATASTGEAAIDQVRETAPDLVLMDIRLQGAMDGIAAARTIREQSDVPIIFLTAYSDDATLQQARASAPYGYLIKPFEERELYAAVETALYRHAMDDKIRKVERWLAATLTSIGDAVIATDTNGRVTFMNQMAERLTNWSRSEALGRPLGEVFRLRAGVHGSPPEDPVRRVLREGVVIGLPPGTLLLPRNSESLVIDDSVAPIRDEQDAITGVVVVFRALADTSQLRQQVSLHDGPTGLPKREILLDRLASMLAAQPAPASYALLLVAIADADSQRAEPLLVTVAQQLVACTQPGELVARLSDERFALLMEQLPTAEAALQRVSTVEAMLANLKPMGGEAPHISLGLVLSAPHYKQPEAILGDGEQLLAQAGQQAGRYVAVRNLASHPHAERRWRLESVLPLALARSELHLCYQPLVALATGALLGFVALPCWPHPTEGLIHPPELAPLVAGVHMQVALARWAVGAAQQFLQTVPHEGDWVLCIPLFGQHPLGADLVAVVREALATGSTPPHRFQLDIHHAALIQADSAAALHDLRMLGVQVAATEVHPDRSPLGLFAPSLVSGLVIASHCIAHSGAPHGQEAGVAALVQLAHMRGLQVAVAGVATDQEAHWLAAHGCDAGWGAWCGPPLDAAGASHLLAASSHGVQQHGTN